MTTAQEKYQTLQNKLAQGWNTWDTRSVTSHVWLPYGLAVMLGFREYKRGRCLKYPLIGRQSGGKSGVHAADLDVVRPGIHSYDGSYTDCTIQWQDLNVRVQTAHCPKDPNVLVIALEALQDNPHHPSAVIIDLGILWNRPGYVQLDTAGLVAHLPDREVRVYHTHKVLSEVWTESVTPFQALALDEPIFITVGQSRTPEEIRHALSVQRQRLLQQQKSYGPLADLYDGQQSALAWDTIYEPHLGHVCSTVSRIWNCNGGGYSLFCWDTYFAGFMAALDNEDLAYANLVEITRTKTQDGFVPNCTHRNFQSRDRSQPPVGSLLLWLIFQRYNKQWICELLFDDLLEWNRWWNENRRNQSYLCWGSNDYEPLVGNRWERHGVGERFGAALESGLDNSPMYDDIPFDHSRSQLALADVGLMSLYIADCEALANIADLLQRSDEASELRQRQSLYQQGLQNLWDDQRGLFLNKRTDTGEWSERISPTLLYPFLCSSIGVRQGQRLLSNTLNNSSRLGGPWLLPSISRDDPCFDEQDYWRGRIWAPMNFLVYLGLRRSGHVEARQALAANSAELFRGEWTKNRHIHENYCAISGMGGNVRSSDRFYHWGALLATINLMEADHYGPMDLSGPSARHA